MDSGLRFLRRRRFRHVFQTADGGVDRQALDRPRRGSVEGKYLDLSVRAVSAGHLRGEKGMREVRGPGVKLTPESQCQ